MENRANNSPVLVWWIIWAAILAGLIMINFFLQPPAEISEGNGAPASIGYIGLAPLLLSFVLRWFVLPRQRHAGPALVVFIIGVAMAESCGILATFLGGKHGGTFFVLGVLGVLQWMPMFAQRFYPAPMVRGLRSRS